MGQHLRVLSVEDSDDDLALVVRNLKQGGYDPLVTRVDTPTALNLALRDHAWDLVLADWNLPHFGALFALEMLKSKGLDLPFIIVSGSITVELAVTAMKAGVHDYVMKHDLSRLVPAIDRELRDAEGRKARRQAERLLAASEERLQLVTRATNDAVRDWDLTTNGVVWNEGFQTMFGYHPEDIEPGVESWYSRMHAEEKEQVIGSCYAAINGTATVWSEEYRFRRRDGTYAYVLDRSYILRNIRGEALRLIGAMTDLTARRQAEEALRQSESRLRALLDSSLDAIIGMDQDGLINSWNARACTMFGWTSQEAIGRPLVDMIIPAAHRAAHLRRLRRFLKRGKSALLNRRLEGTALRRDGTAFPVELSVVSLMEGSAVSFYGFLADIEDRKRAESALQHTAEQLRQSQKMEAIGQLAGGVAHDFNNLLTVITGYSDLLLAGLPPDAPERSELGEIRNAAERASWLTRQLLAFSRRQVLATQVLSVNVQIINLEKMLRRLIGEDIEIKTSLEPDLAHIKSDPGQIEQVIMNLVVNARDAMPTGGRLTIETRNVEIDESYPKKIAPVPLGRYVLLAISDSGCGIPAEIQERIFEPFFTTKEPGRGTGLGLSTVYGIVKQSGGFIWVYSEPGQGTVFRIYLPVVEEDVTPARGESRTDQHSVGVETILLVEDADTVRALTKKVLKSSGYTVLTARNCEEALAVARNHPDPIHLLLTDVVMPGCGGKVTAQRLSAERPDIKVVFMSGYTGAAMEHNGLLEAGAILVQKPFTTVGLRQIVRTVLDEPLKGQSLPPSTKAARDE